jgi:hypothetical protein
MRSIELLVREYPYLTGREILETQEQEKLKDQRAYEKRNKKKLAFIKDINENGGFYRGRFGVDQHYYYRIFDLKMETNGEVYMQVESIVLFFNDTNDTHQVTKPNEVHLERRLRTYEKLDQFGLQQEQRVTAHEWDAVVNYINAMSQLFWGDIKKVK